VGALSAINGVAASFAEEIPVLSVVGESDWRRWCGGCTAVRVLQLFWSHRKHIPLRVAVVCESGSHSFAS